MTDRISILPVELFLFIRNYLQTTYFPFHLVKLSFCRMLDTSLFANVEIIALWYCSKPTDIFPIRNVPYLRLCRCDGIADFFCLGSQRFLEIFNCPIEDNHICVLGNIPCLELASCSKIKQIRGLDNNSFLIVSQCSQVKEISCTGTNYTKITISSGNLQKLVITGFVYVLETTESVTVDISPSCYKYWDNSFCDQQ
jgi:hypothetical protein